MKNKIVVFTVFTVLFFSVFAFSQNKSEATEVDFKTIISLVEKKVDSKIYSVNFKNYNSEAINFIEAKNHILGNTSVNSVVFNESEMTLIIDIKSYQPSYFILNLLNDAKIFVPVPTNSDDYLKSID